MKADVPNICTPLLWYCPGAIRFTFVGVLLRFFFSSFKAYSESFLPSFGWAPESSENDIIYISRAYSNYRSQLLPSRSRTQVPNLAQVETAAPGSHAIWLCTCRYRLWLKENRFFPTWRGRIRIGWPRSRRPRRTHPFPAPWSMIRRQDVSPHAVRSIYCHLHLGGRLGTFSCTAKRSWRGKFGGNKRCRCDKGPWN